MIKIQEQRKFRESGSTQSEQVNQTSLCQQSLKIENSENQNRIRGIDTRPQTQNSP